ncbi:MAG: thiamine biosynthesis protein ApbE [Sphingomonas sp.]|nr:MAG: thiamine biosynthesis protein ApbE [Sphingomonas sp.]
MGTGWSLAIAGGPRDARARVEAVLAEVVAESSLWVENSEISRFNHASAGTAVLLSAGFRQVVEAALAIGEASDGAFDPGLAAFSDRWGFGPGGAPDGARAGAWRSLRLDGDRLIQPGTVALDLNAIAKGQAVDRVATALLAAGCTHFLIGIGGEYRGEGVRLDGQPWWVEIEQPPGAALPPLRIALAGLSIATSGDYRRAILRGGRRFSHSLDPATGQPIAEGVASVAVLGRHCMIADAEATAITVLGADRGYEWAVSRGLAVQILLREGGSFRERLTPALTAMLG